MQISDEHVAGTLSMRLEWMCPSVRQWSIVEYARIGGGQQAAGVGSRERLRSPQKNLKSAHSSSSIPATTGERSIQPKRPYPHHTNALTRKTAVEKEAPPPRRDACKRSDTRPYIQHSSAFQYTIPYFFKLSRKQGMRSHNTQQKQ